MKYKVLLVMFIIFSFRIAECYFTSDSSMKKEWFIHQINASFGGGLTCSLNDYQLSEYVQHRLRRQGKLPVKYAVEKVGPQSNGWWVLGSDVCISSSGKLHDPLESNYIWIGHLYSGPGIAPQHTVSYPCQLTH